VLVLLVELGDALVEQDFQAFVEAVRSGRLEAVEGV